MLSARASARNSLLQVPASGAPWNAGVAAAALSSTLAVASSAVVPGRQVVTRHQRPPVAKTVSVSTKRNSAAIAFGAMLAASPFFLAPPMRPANAAIPPATTATDTSPVDIPTIHPRQAPVADSRTSSDLVSLRIRQSLAQKAKRWGGAISGHRDRLLRDCHFATRSRCTLLRSCASTSCPATQQTTEADGSRFGRVHAACGTGTRCVLG